MTAKAANAQHRRMRRLWADLPSGTLTEGELDAQIIRLASLYEGDFAAAGAYRSTLTRCGAVTAHQVAGSRDVTYERASEFPEYEDVGYGTDAYNQQLQRQHEEWEAELRRQDEIRARDFESSPFGIQQRQVREMIDQRFNELFSEQIGELRRQMEPKAVSRMRDRLTTANGRNTTDEAGNGRPEREKANE